MHIDFVEIANFRKLSAARVGLSREKTVFVGANNSGKTSAMVALRYFLVEQERSSFSLNDFTLSHWPVIDAMGKDWEDAYTADNPIPDPAWETVLPFLDIWLHVADSEVHYVQKILPTLDWEGGRLGVRLRFEPKDALELQKEYLKARAHVAEVQKAAIEIAAEGTAEGGSEETFTVSLWPQNLTHFLKRRLQRVRGSEGLFHVRTYVLDRDKLTDPEHGLATPQPLIKGSEPIDGDPLKGLIRIDEISAQRGFGNKESARSAGDDDSGDGGTSASGQRKLSEQLRQYYRRHLDPQKNPDAQDLHALIAFR